jgi:hypothetical protein
MVETSTRAVLSPPREATGTGAFTPAESEANNPDNREDDRQYPQQMYGESQAEQEQHHQ